MSLTYDRELVKSGNNGVGTPPTFSCLQNIGTETCLEPRDLVSTEGAPVRAHPARLDEAVDYQMWAVTEAGMIRNLATGFVLEARRDGGADPWVCQNDAKDSTSDQRSRQWTIWPDGRITNALYDGLVLGLTTSAISSAVLVKQDQTRPPAQRWRRIASVRPRPYQFFVEHASTKGVLTPSGGALGSGTPLAVEAVDVPYPQTQLWSWAGSGPLTNSEAALVAQLGADDRVRLATPPPDGGDRPENQRWTYRRDGRIAPTSGGGVLGLVDPRARERLVAVGPDTRSADQQWAVRRAVYPQPVSLARAVRLSGRWEGMMVLSEGPQLQDFTVEAWVRTTTGGPVFSTGGRTTGVAPVVFGITGGGAFAFRVIDGTVQRAGTTTASLVTEPTGVLDGGWHHVAGVRRGGALTVYLDGVPVRAVDSVAPGRAPRPVADVGLNFGCVRPDNGVIKQEFLDGDLAEIRLWARARTALEIPAGMHHRVSDTDRDLLGRWAFLNDNGADSSLNRRAASFIGTPAFLDSDVELVAPGDFYLVTQARLMQDYVHTAGGGAGPSEVDGYRVTLNIRDGNDQSTAGFVTIALNNPDLTPTAVLHLNDASAVTLDADHPRVFLSTDAQGLVSFTIDAAGDLTCPMLRVQADFMTDDSWLVVAPDRQAHAALSTVSGNALRGRDDNGDPIPDRVSPLPADVDASTAAATATAINQLMSTAVQHNAQATTAQMRPLAHLLPTPRTRPYVPRYQLSGVVARGHDPRTDAIATHHVDRDTPVARILDPTKAQHAHWAFDYRSFVDHRPEQAADEIANLSSLKPVGDLALRLLPELRPDHIRGTAAIVVTADQYQRAAAAAVAHGPQLSSWLRDHVAAAVRVLVNTVQVNVIDPVTGIGQKIHQLIVTAVDELNQARYALIQAVEHAVDAVAGFFTRLGSDIERLVKFLRDLFHWQDVVNTQRMLHTYIKNLRPFVSEVIGDALGRAHDTADQFKGQIDARIEEWRRSLRQSGAQTATSDAATGPPTNLKSNYVSTMTSSSLSAGAAGSGPGGWSDQLRTGELESIATGIAGQWIASIRQTWEALPGQIANTKLGAVSDVRSFLVDGIEILLDTLKTLVDATVDSLVDLVDGLRNTVDALLKALFAVAEQEIDIPVVTPFYEKVVMGGSGEKLTMLGLSSLLGAMTMTFAYKLGHDDAAPFSAADAKAFDETPPEQYTWLVNPFRPRGRTTQQSGVEIENIAVLVNSFGVAGSATLTIFSTLNDALFCVDTTARLNGPFQHIGNQIRYKLGHFAGVVERICSVGIIVGNVVMGAAAITATVQAFQDDDIRAGGTLVFGCLAAGCVVASSVIGAFDKSWAERGDTIVLTVVGAVNLVLTIVVWKLIDEPDDEDRLILALGIVGSIGMMAQGLKFVVVHTEGIARTVAQFALLAISDGAGAVASLVLYGVLVGKTRPSTALVAGRAL